MRCIGEYEKILAAVTSTDVEQLIDLMELGNEDKVTTCIGIASPTEPPPWFPQS